MTVNRSHSTNRSHSRTSVACPPAHTTVAQRCLGLVASLAATGTLVATLASADLVLLPAKRASAATTSACTGTVAGVTVSGGNDQVGKVGTAYPEALQVEVVDTTGCGVSGTDVTFSAPSFGASGTFAGGVTEVTVTTSSSGVATAPTFTANAVTGNFDVTAEVDGFSIEVSLTNSTLGVASSLQVVSGAAQTAAPGRVFTDPLVVSVEDSSGNPVSGATVTFAVTAGTTGASATFTGAGASTTDQTDESGQATSPHLTAATTSGSFSVTASVSGVSEAATFTETVGSGTPDAITAGAGTSQQAEAGTDFAVPLAVTVTDSNGNDVAGAAVTFKAPSSGPTGVFAGAGHTAIATTNSDGVATAPAFVAGLSAGGYVVTAAVTGIAPAASFAMVDEARTTASTSGPKGNYRLVTDTGQVLSSGAETSFGSLPASELGGQKVVGIADTKDAKGYWLVTAEGKVYAFGDAKAYGSPSSVAAPIVGIAATPDAKGYWLVASDGGIFNYGDARYYGSAGKVHLTKPIVGIAATPDAKGYWLVASDGGIFAFGKATFYGSGTMLSPKPVTAIVPTADGGGYWVVSANGTAAGFGDAGAQGTPTLKTPTVVGGA